MNSLYASLVLALASMVFGGFSAIFLAHFASEKAEKIMKFILVLSNIAIANFIYLTYLRLGMSLSEFIASLIILVAIVVFGAWTVKTTRRASLRLAFDGAPPDSLLVTGPYGWVRHPFYCCYIAFWFFCAASARSVIGLGLASILTGFYVIAARREEKSFGGSGFAHAYREYADKVGGFLPRCRRG